MKRTILILALALPVSAQTAKPKDEPKPPVITDKMRADFFKAQAKMLQDNSAAQQSQTAFQGIVAEIQKTCGDDYTAQVNPNGDPVCVAKPKPEAKK